MDFIYADRRWRAYFSLDLNTNFPMMDPKVLHETIFATQKEMVQMLLYYTFLWTNQTVPISGFGLELSIGLVGWIEDEIDEIEEYEAICGEGTTLA